MAIELTPFPLASDPNLVSALQLYDAETPDGLTKEIIARLIVVGLLDVGEDSKTPMFLHGLIEGAIKRAVADGTSVVNTFVEFVLELEMLHVAEHDDASDAIAKVASVVSEVVSQTPRTKYPSRRHMDRCRHT